MCAAAAHAAGFPGPDLRPTDGRRRRDDKDSPATGYGDESPALLMPPDRLPELLSSTVHHFSLAWNAALRLLSVVCYCLLRARSTKGSRVPHSSHLMEVYR